MPELELPEDDDEAPEEEVEPEDELEVDEVVDVPSSQLKVVVIINVALMGNPGPGTNESP